MAIPTYDKFIEPILRFLAAHPEGVRARDGYEAAATMLSLTDEERLHLVPSGVQLVYKNRASWAHDRLKRANLSSMPRRGYWKITEAGRAYVDSHQGKLPAEEVERIATEFMDVRLRPLPASAELPLLPESAPAASETPPLLISPDERLGEALIEIRASVRVQLVEALATVDPAFFETIVLDLLHRMGYGTNRTDLQRVGRSGDGGIDGTISLDRLGLDKVYVQAKRWQSSIGRPEIQGFYGALAGQRAKRGVFITTSTFTSQATDFARSVEGIVLVDGVRLADLMIDHEVGISSRTVKIPRLDSDYFEGEEL